MAISPQIIRSQLRDAARKLRWSRSMRFLLGGIGLSAVFIVLFLALDAWMHFGPAGRWAGFCAMLASLLAGAALCWRAWIPVISESSIARRIEQKGGTGEGNVLISAVQFDQALPMDSSLRTAFFSEMTDPLPGVRWDEVFDARRLKQLGAILASACLILVGWAILKPNYFANSAARLFLPASQIAPLTRTKFDAIIPRNDTVVRGRELLLSATLGGEVPKTAWVHFKEEGSGWQKALLDREAGNSVFTHRWPEVKQPFQYYIEAGDAQSPSYKIGVRPKTAIKSRVAEITPPAYTGLPKQTVSDFNVLENLVPGSKVGITLDFNNSVSAVSATDDKGAAIATQEAPDGKWMLSMPVLTNRTLKLAYQDVVGQGDQATLQVSVRADEPPKVAIVEPAEGRELTATKGSSLAIKFDVTCRFGLASAALYQSTDEKDDAKLIQEFSDVTGLKSFAKSIQVSVTPIGDADKVVYRIIAKDRNDITGPGVTVSRPIVVSLQSADQATKQAAEASKKLQKGLEALAKLQALNLDESRAVVLAKSSGSLASLVQRQSDIAEEAGRLAASVESLSSVVRRDLTSMLGKEMKDAVILLRNGGSAAEPARSKFLVTAITTEAIILARLQASPSAAEDDAKKAAIAEIVSGVEDLLKREREILRETKAGPDEALAKLSDRQDALAERASAVRKSVETDSKNAAIGDADFRKRLSQVAAMFGELKIYEDMLGAAELLQTKNATPAMVSEERVVNNLSKMTDILNQWQIADAQKKAEELKKEAQDMQQKLEKLAVIQREIVEKSKDTARKDDFRPEDIATAEEVAEQKDLMKEVVEKMTTDLQAFPEMKSGNEMKVELMSILEDVQQADLEEIAGNKLKVQELAVEKEQATLDAIEAAKKIAADMEMWLPNKAETQKWLMENFDKTEMPEIPNLPLADAMEDLVGDLLETQKDLEQDIQDASSNQAVSMNAGNGWEVRDGPIPGFGAQGKSGNEAPNHNEQMGRSSGGREGMSNGEMAAGEASNLKGDTPDVRRTNDPLQQGQVKDEGGIGKTRATGGGKAGGFSDRNGMDGNAPVRAVRAPEREVQDAAAVKQAILAEKTSKKAAQASLLYRRSDGLTEVARLMDANAEALRQGRMKDSQSLHQRIIGKLREIKGGMGDGDVMSVSTGGDTRDRDKQLLGGNEGETPAQYKDMAADYFRSLTEDK